MMKMLTPLVLGSAVYGGLTVMSSPLAFRSLASLRYPKKPVAWVDRAVPQEIRLSSRELLREIVPVRQDGRLQDQEVLSVAWV